MRVNTQPLNVNTLKTSNINKSADKSSGKIAVTASRIQNNAEQCPVTSKKKVCFSDVSQMKEFFSKDAPIEVSKTQSFGISTSSGLPITSKKTVTTDNIKNLKSDTSKDLSSIAKKIKSIGTSDGRGCKVILSKNTMTTLNNKLSELKGNIQNYRNELERSTYQHNSKKENALNELEGKINNTIAIFHQGNAKNSFLSGEYSIDKTSRTSADIQKRKADYKTGNGYY
ncbi:TPA: hypothetical protein KEY68_001405 [Providencia rettgeri]|uniref:hypothetical protein n=1 Tax=Providencia TaxID=586 RepID=UPI001B93B987|nr:MULTISPECIES: hypothetical protein [Providencia]HBC7429153.1 hypothetical protein [Providencia rettgeri]